MRQAWPAPARPAAAALDFRHCAGDLADHLLRQDGGAGSRMCSVRSLLWFLWTALATLACAVLVGCSGARVPGAARASAAPSPPPSASGPRAHGRLGSPANPLVLSCAEESFPEPPVPQRPRPADLVIGPLDILNGRILATMSPSRWGYRRYGHGGRSYKIPLFVARGATATLTIGAPARHHVVIDNPYAHERGLGGVTSVTYRSCLKVNGFFAQGFAFASGPVRGCVPLDVRIGRGPRIRHVTLSIFAGSCTARA